MRMPSQVRAWRHDRHLAARWPALHDSIRQARNELAEIYLEYVSTVSARGHAISIELASTLLAICRATEAKTVADLGSGFSSYVTRRYAAESGASVVSVDSSPDWLQRTREFVAHAGLDESEGFFTWKEFSEKEVTDKYDVVLHDLGDMTLRVSTLSQALLLASRGGEVILDDVHKPGFGAHAQRIAAASALWWLDMRRVTEDDLGRYAMLIHRI